MPRSDRKDARVLSVTFQGTTGLTQGSFEVYSREGKNFSFKIKFSNEKINKLKKTGLDDLSDASKSDSQVVPRHSVTRSRLSQFVQ